MTEGFWFIECLSDGQQFMFILRFSFQFTLKDFHNCLLCSGHTRRSNQPHIALMDRAVPAGGGGRTRDRNSHNIEHELSAGYDCAHGADSRSQCRLYSFMKWNSTFFFLSFSFLSCHINS